MSTEEFIIGLFIRVDSMMRGVQKHPDAHLYPSEVVSLGLLFALKGDGPRRFYRWLMRDYRPWFPRLPERTRLFRLFAAHANWTELFLAQPTLLGAADTFGIELIHPWREDRSEWQIGRKRVSAEEGESAHMDRVACTTGLHDGLVQHPRHVGRNPGG